MKLEFLFVPTSNLNASLALYRDGFGFTEMWREGDATVALALPGSDAQIMLDANDPDAPLGPLFVVDSLAGAQLRRSDRPRRDARAAATARLSGARAGERSPAWSRGLRCGRRG